MTEHCKHKHIMAIHFVEYDDKGAISTQNIKPLGLYLHEYAHEDDHNARQIAAKLVAQISRHNI